MPSDSPAASVGVAMFSANQLINGFGGHDFDSKISPEAAEELARGADSFSRATELMGVGPRK